MYFTTFIRRIFLLISATIITFGICPSSKAQEENGKSSFQLNATYEELPKLSRTEIAPANTSPRQVAYLSKGQGNTNNNLNNINSANDEATNLNRLIFQESQIDWSSWIGSLADRWFYNLRNKEKSLGIQYHTKGPALIQFTCYANGEISNISLRQSSGIKEYDRMQIEALMEITPLPPFPLGTQRKSLTLTQGWESHLKEPGERDYQPGSFGRSFPKEHSGKWVTWQ